ncbi:MAG: effector, partial [Columbia Basin potato purple top phytoplasma]
MFNIIKKSIKWIFIILGLLLVLFIGWIVLTEMEIIKLPKEEIPRIKECTFEKVNEWYDTNNKCTMIRTKYTFDGLNGIGYYQEQLANKANIGAFEFTKIQDRLESQPEPSNLVCYIKDRHPFDRWNRKGKTYEYTTLNGFKHSSFDTKDDSYLDNYVNFEKRQHEGPGGNSLIVKYKGPKHFLEDDKDYYLGRARV